MIKIPRDVQSVITASYYINSFKGAVEELVYNSLDANATSIAIRVNIQESFIQVVDNGSGIKCNDFYLLGQRYATSKFVDISDLKRIPHVYGYSGLSLATIIKVCHEVKIVSKFQNSQETWMKVFSGGECKQISEITTRPSKGTTVDIKGFFYNLKIQRRAIESSSELLAIKTLLEQLSLIHVNVSFSLRDDGKNEIIFQIHKNRDIYSTISSLFEIMPNEFQELQVEKKEYKVKAFIGKRNNDFIKYQWIFLNRKFVFKSTIHRIMNKHLIKSFYIQQYKPTKKHKLNKDEMCNEDLPFYFIFISCPYLDYDLNFNLRKTIVEFKNWDQITNLLQKLVQCYSGDIKLKEVTKQYIKSNENNQYSVKHNENNTREEVKKIIEKILVNNPKNQKEIQNGVKGKNIKRKTKLITLKTVQNKNKPKEISKASLLSQTKALSTKLTKSDTKIKIPKIKNSKRKTTIKQVKKKIEIKENVSKKSTLVNDPIVKKFINPSESLQERCRLLSEATKNIQLKQKQMFKKNCNLNLNDANSNFKNTKKTNVTKTIPYYDIDPKEVDNQKLCKDKVCQYSKNAIISSHDLVHTILQNETDDKRNSDYQYKIKANIQPQTTKINHLDTIHEISTNNDIFSAKLTYESHNYNLNGKLFEKRYSRKMHYVSNASINISSQKNRKVSNLKYVVNKKKNCSKVNKASFLNSMKMGLNDSVYSIEAPDSVHKFNVKPNIRYSNTSNVSLSVDNDRTINRSFIEEITTRRENTYTIENIPLDCNEDLNKNINLEYNITYSIQLSKNIINSPTEMCRIENTYINHGHNENFVTKNCNNIEPTFTECNKHLNEILKDKSTEEINSIFNSTSKYRSAESLDPLVICETIMGTTNDGQENKIEHSIIANDSIFKQYEHLENLSEDNKMQSTKIANVTSHYFNSLFTQEMNEMFLDTFHMGNTNLQNDEMTTEQIGSNNNNLNDFIIQSRHTFMPKGMSPIIQNCNKQTLKIHSTEDEYYGDEIYENFAESVLETAQIFEPKIQNVNETKDLNKVNNKIQKDNADLIFDTESIKQAKILGQVDCKFIATIMQGKVASNNTYSDFLVLFDQHAVHERIRLEKNLSDYFDVTSWRSVKIDAISFKLSKDDAIFLHNYKDKLTAFGLQWSISNNIITVYEIPQAILGKITRQVEFVLKAVKSLLAELIDALKFLKGNIPLYPQSIMNLVCSEACRYAIMFGDKLSKSNCIALLESLAECKTPFQCAHGRPVMAVIMEMDRTLPKYRINFQNIKLFKDLDIGEREIRMDNKKKLPIH